MAFWQVWGTVRVRISQSHRLCTHNSNRHDIDCPAHHPARKMRKRNSLKLHQYTEPMLTCYLYLVQRLRGSTGCGLLATELAFPPQLLPLFVPPAQRLRLHTLKFKKHSLSSPLLGLASAKKASERFWTEGRLCILTNFRHSRDPVFVLLPGNQN